MAKYAEWPVSLHTGMPNIDIPLVELRERTVKVPVSLSYHASGLKVSEIASSVGLGWTLNAGGVITRSRQGRADEDPQHGFFEFRKRYADKDDLTSTLAPQYTQAEVLNDLANQDEDGELDAYNLNAMGQSYKIMFMGDGSIITSPYSNVKINVDFDTDEWTVLLEDGTKLIFGGQGNFETTTESSDVPPYVSAWWLRSVTGLTGEVVTFSYTDDIVYQTGNVSQKDKRPSSGETSTGVVACACVNSSQSQGSPNGDSSADILVNIRNLTTIESETTRIDLILNDSGNERQDAEGGRFYTTVSVYSKTKEAFIEKFALKTGYSDAAVGTSFTEHEKTYHKKRLKLKGVSKLDVLTGQPVENWTFEYNPEKLPSRLSKARDHWGYYNGALTNESLLPFFPEYPDPEYKSGNREPNADFIQAEMLTKIYYPTGGYSEFNYVANTVNGTRDTYDSDLVEIRKTIQSSTDPLTGSIPFTITHRQSVSIGVELVVTGLEDFHNLNSTIYVYDQWNSLIANYGVDPEHEQVHEAIFLNAGDYTLRYAVTGLDPGDLDLSNNINLYAGFPIRVKSTEPAELMVGGVRIDKIDDYKAQGTTPITRHFVYEGSLVQIPFDAVNEYLTDTDEEMPVRTMEGCGYKVDSGCFQPWEYRSSNLKTYLTAAPVTFDKVTTYYGPTGENGKTISFFYNPDDLGTSAANAFPFPPVVSRAWCRGQLRMKTDYDKDNHPIRRTINEYDSTLRFTIVNKKCGRKRVMHMLSLNDPLNANTVTHFEYSVESGLMSLMSSTEVQYQYDLNQHVDSTYVTTIYKYENPNSLLPTSSEFENSEGDVIKTFSRTALDKEAIIADATLTTEASNAINSMLTRNMISQPIQVATTKGSELISIMTTNFKVTNSIVVPKDVVFKLGDHPAETRLMFNEYDEKGNLLEQQKTNDVRKSYVYDYDFSRLTAEVSNASAASIAYTSFEGHGNGNWNFVESINTDNAWSGARSYSLVNKTITKTALPANTYVVSLWATSSTYIIINTQTLSSTYTVNGWSYYEYTSPPATTSITITGNAMIDELRLHPKEAMMTTYTYDIGGGVSSIADPNSNITHYEYDGLGRLKLIKDKERNILKRYSYNYQIR